MSYGPRSTPLGPGGPLYVPTTRIQELQAELADLRTANGLLQEEVRLLRPVPTPPKPDPRTRVVRVLRIIEYTYSGPKVGEAMQYDMEHWKVQHTLRPTTALLIRSTTVTPEFKDE
jgi:hypothetical protein